MKSFFPLLILLVFLGACDTEYPPRDIDSISIESINQIRKSNVEAVVENLDQIIEDNNIKCVL